MLCFLYFTHGTQLFSCSKCVSYFLSSHLAHYAVLTHQLRGVWYEHDVTSDDEAEENQDPIAEDQHDEESGDEVELEESYDETD